MASEKAKELAAKQKAEIKAEKLRKKNSDDPRDWGRIRQFVEAYKRTNEVDPTTRWWMIGTALGTVAVIAAIGALSGLAWWAWLPLALMSGVLVAMVVLTRKAKTAMIKRYEGQPGSAEVALQMLSNKKYTYTMAIAVTRELDLVHRVVGPGGIVLIGEGQAGRARKLLSGELKRHSQVKRADLQKRIEKMPKVLEPYQLTEIRSRLAAMDAVRPKAPLPKGPMPTAKGVNRALRGR